MIVNVGGDVKIKNLAKSVQSTAVIGLIEFGSATSVICQIISSQIACNALLLIRPQKGMPNEYYLSSARLIDLSLQDNQEDRDAP